MIEITSCPRVIFRFLQSHFRSSFSENCRRFCKQIACAEPFPFLEDNQSSISIPQSFVKDKSISSRDILMGLVQNFFTVAVVLCQVFTVCLFCVRTRVLRHSAQSRQSFLLYLESHPTESDFSLMSFCQWLLL